MRKIYLDNAATTPVVPKVLKVMFPYFKEYFGNPSSIHGFGQKAKQSLDSAREQVANLINCSSKEIVFTSGGTESNNLALKGIFYSVNQSPINIITSSIEHYAILEPCKFLQNQGAEVTYIPVDKHGLIDPEDIQKSIQDNTVLISIMHANNEIGTIQPIKIISEIITKEREKRKQNNNPLPLYFHTDAAQTVGHIPVDVNNLGVDFLSMSAHKLYGPKGVGALYIRESVDIVPLIHGSGQEKGRRGSTENVAGIVGFGKACEIAKKEYKKEVRQTAKLRDYFINKIKLNIKNISINGHSQKRLPNNVNITINGVEADTLVIALDEDGIACSSGSACTARSVDPSHVLLAIGLNRDEAFSSLRFSLGKWTTKKDIDYTIHQLITIIKRLRGT